MCTPPFPLPPAAHYIETLKFNKKYKVRVAGDSSVSDARRPARRPSASSGRAAARSAALRGAHTPPKVLQPLPLPTPLAAALRATPAMPHCVRCEPLTRDATYTRPAAPELEPRVLHRLQAGPQVGQERQARAHAGGCGGARPQAGPREARAAVWFYNQPAFTRRCGPPAQRAVAAARGASACKPRIYLSPCGSPHCTPALALRPQAAGPILSYKLKPASGWKVANEASLKTRTLYSSITYKAMKGE